MTLKHGNKGHVLTDADRQRALEVRRQKSEERKRRAEEMLAVSGLPKAVRTHMQLLNGAEQESVRMQAVREVYDRTLGRPVQRTELSGGLDVSVDVPALRAKLVAMLERRTARAEAVDVPATRALEAGDPPTGAEE